MGSPPLARPHHGCPSSRPRWRHPSCHQRPHARSRSPPDTQGVPKPGGGHRRDPQIPPHAAQQRAHGAAIPKLGVLGTKRCDTPRCSVSPPPFPSAPHISPPPPQSPVPPIALRTPHSSLCPPFLLPHEHVRPRCTQSRGGGGKEEKNFPSTAIPQPPTLPAPPHSVTPENPKPRRRPQHLHAQHNKTTAQP